MVVCMIKGPSKALNMFLAARTLSTGKDTIFMDIGANIGVFSFFAVRAGCECHAFEPHPYYNHVLKTRAQLLKMERVFRPVGNLQVHNVALSDQTGHTTLYHHSTKPGSHSLDREKVINEGELAPRSIPVEMMSLDQFVSSHSWKKESDFFLKIDVEGVEANMIRGGMGFIEKYHPDLFVEVRGTGAQCSFKQISDLLLPLGYYLYTNEYTPCKMEEGSLVEWPTFMHTDVLFSFKQVDPGRFSGCNFLSRNEKWLRLIRRSASLQFADLHPEAIRYPLDGFY